MSDEAKPTKPPVKISRRRVSLRVAPMRRVDMGRWLGGGARPVRGLKSNSDVALFLLKRSLADLGGTPLDGPNPETDERVARMMAYETMQAVQRAGDDSSMHWYTDSLRRAENVLALLHPEINDDARAAKLTHIGIKTSEDARTVMFCALAITSLNMKVRDNAKSALEQYRCFLRDGRFTPKGYGSKGASVRENLKQFNELLEVCGGDISRLHNFLMTPFKMADLRAAGEKHGIRVGGRELADEIVYGSMVFGPKIGNAFLQNLLGNMGPITIDLWMQRTWGRYTGRLMKISVSDVQKQRLLDTLRDNPMASQMTAEELIWEPDVIAEMDNDDLLDVCRVLSNFWNRAWNSLSRKGYDNESLAALKTSLGWPGAAAAIVKSLGSTVDAPGSRMERRWIRNTVARALEILDGNGIKMDAATLQATLWFEEKSAWDHLAGRKIGEYNVAYDEAMAELARREGSEHEFVEQALRAPIPDRPGACGLARTIDRREAGTAEGLFERTPVSGGDAETGEPSRSRARGRRRMIAEEVTSLADATAPAM